MKCISLRNLVLTSTNFMKIYNTIKQIAVTGSVGFLGFHLCKRLLDEDYNVICRANFFSDTKDDILLLMEWLELSPIVNNKDLPPTCCD